MNYGFVPSKIDGTELLFKEEKGMKLPEKYSYKKFLPEVMVHVFTVQLKK